MRKKPRIFLMLAVIYVAVAFSLPIQLMWLYDHPIQEMSEVLAKLTYTNWLMAVGLIATAWMLLAVHSKAWYFVAGSVCLVTFNNLLVGWAETDFSLNQALGSAGLFLALNLFLLLPASRLVLLHPDKRWWMVPVRQKVQVPLFLGAPKQVALRAETFDISESGLFVPLQEKFSAKLAKLHIEEPVTLCLTLGAVSQLRCDGKVVRKADPNGQYPAGIGIQFVNMGFKQRRELKRFLSRQPSL